MNEAKGSEAVGIAAATIDAAAIASARRVALQSGRSWLGVLEDSLGIEPPAFVAALAQATRHTMLSAADLMVMRAKFGLLPYSDAVHRECAVVRDRAGRLYFVFADPLNKDNQRWAQAALPSATLPRLAHRDDIAAYLARQEETLRAIDPALAGGELPDADEDGIEVISLESIGEDESPVVRLVNSFLYDALKLRASDIHLRGEPGGMAIKLRLDGVLVRVSTIAGREMGEQVVSRIKVLSDLDIAERRVPQDGRFRVRTRDASIDFRVSIMPSIHGEDAVLRLLDRRSLTEGKESLRLTDLGLDAASISVFRRLVSHPYGMILVTGPTGSGKTTTLYAEISEINTGHNSIITIEDPVEYQLPGVLQIPVNEKKGLTFARGLRSILRHDPDRIMVGEIRDAETAQIAVQAALTGHLVFTTVHANNVFDVLGRFLHMGVDPYSFSSALIGIWAQRLVRVNCPDCTRPIQPDKRLLAESALSVEEAARYRFRAGQGCGQCRGTGYRGRVAISEFLIINDRLRECIANKESVAVFKEEAQRQGARTLRLSALALVREGRTTLEEINRVSFAS